MSRPARTPRIRIHGPAGTPRGAVLVLHGGRAASTAAARPWGLAALRMVPFAQSLQGTPGLLTCTVGYRYRGWNGEAAHPVADVRWAIGQVRERFGELPVVLVGHSMGGRAAVRAGGAEQVVAIAALAPWLPEGEPVTQLSGRTLLIAHGDHERMTDPAESLAYALRARGVTDAVCYFDVHGDGHAMLRRAGDWHHLVTRFVRGALGIEPIDAEIANALRMPAARGLRVPLSRAG